MPSAAQPAAASGQSAALARQLGSHGHGWTGPSGTENKMLSQERRRKLPTLPLTSSLLFTVYWAGMLEDQKALCICLCGGQQGGTEKKIQTISKSWVPNTIYLVHGNCHFPKRRRRDSPSFGDGRNTQCAPLMSTVSLFSSPGCPPIRGLQRMLGFQSKRKISHNKTSLRMPGSLLQGISAVLFSQRRGLP